MKKTLIAIAALAATGAFAQSTVTIRGGFDTGLVQYDMKGAKVSGIAGNLSSTSGLFIEGTGDLGGGLKANFLLESDFNTSSVGGNTGTTANTVGAAGTAGATATGLTNGTGSTFGNGEVFVALSGGFGNLKLGAMNNNGLAAHGTANPFGTAIGSGFRATSTSAANAGSGALVRNDNTFAYTTPTMFGGFTGQWLARKQQASSATNANFNASFGAQQQSQVSEVALRYNAGPLNAILARSMEDATNVMSATAGTGALTAGNKGVLNSIAANYNMGALTVYGGWQGQKTNNGAGVAQRDTTGVNIAAKYVMGVNTFAINLGRLSGAVTAANVAASASGTTSLVGLGYEYALAKNAAVTARYERLSEGNTNTLGVAATTGYASIAGNNDRSRMGLGIRYNF